MNIASWVPALISMVGAVIVAWLAKRQSATAAKIAAESAPYPELGKRTAKLERIVDEMRGRLHVVETDLDVTVDALWCQIEWRKSGAKPPPPEVSARALEAVHRRLEARKAMTVLIEGDGEDDA